MTILDEQPTTHHPRGLEVCIDCGQHEDAPIHHTPERISGNTGPAVGWRMSTDPFTQGAKLLAAKLTPNGMGYGYIQGPCQDALEDLVAAGWTPPAEGSGTEAERLRAELAKTRQRLEDMQQHLGRLTVENDAMDQFRVTLIELGQEIALKRVNVALAQREEFNAAIAEVKYSREDFEKFLRKAADVCAKEAEKHRAMVKRQGERHEKRRAAVQDALFDTNGA